MKKAFAKYLFPLFILLLGGFINHLYADTQNGLNDENAFYLGYQCIGRTAVDVPQIAIEKSLFVEVTDIEEQEERDENLASFNTNFQFGSYLTAFFYASVSRQEFRELDINLGFFEPTSITAPYRRNIRFQVFRI
jgi:hypothetical protein